MKKKYAIVGTGGRAPMFLEPIFAEYRSVSTLVAMCDPSPARMRFHLGRIREVAPDFSCPQYGPGGFAEMIRKERPDVVIVCTPDHLHDEYIVQSVRLGCDVICEKPVTIDARRAKRIRDAVRKAGRSVRVTFNYRWTAGVTKVWKLIHEGVIGSVKHVSMDYLLNTRHGADYFRRWHSRMENSGGLLVHKSTHHFDLVNWWLDSIPEEVYASGDLAFYGRDNAVRRGDGKYTRYERYTDRKSEGDPFRLDLNRNRNLRGLYLEAEPDNGYVRDRNVFRDGIDIYDTMSVLVRYKSGVVLNYSLNAFCPYEGYHVRITGDRGMIEYTELHASHIITGQSNAALASEQEEETPPQKLIVYPHFQEPYQAEVEKLVGSHGGGDPLLQEQIFSRRPRKEKFRRNAGHEQGIASAIIGISANTSIRRGGPVKVRSLYDFGPDAQRLSDLK